MAGRRAICSLAALGTALVLAAPGYGAFPGLTDGTHVFFESLERSATEDTDNRYDVYERSGGQTRLA